jgi:hypothetical protein
VADRERDSDVDLGMATGSKNKQGNELNNRIWQIVRQISPQITPKSPKSRQYAKGALICGWLREWYLNAVMISFWQAKVDHSILHQ